MRLLIVEDERRLALSLAKGLTAEGYAVDVVHDGLTGLRRATETPYDLIVLDIMLPGMNGYRICATLRAAGHDVPILMLTAKDGEYDEAEGLDTGADDYLTKPFSYVVLVARVRALLRRRGRHGASPVRTVGPLRVDSAARRVTRDGAEIALTTKEFAVLEQLAERAGRGGVQGADPGARLGLRLRGRPEHRRGVRQRTAPQAGRGADPHGPGRRVPAGGAAMRRLFGSVRARAALGATLVVAVALLAAGTAVLLSLYSNLTEQAGTQAERSARAVAAVLAGGKRYDQLSLDDDDRPVQVVDEDGRLVAASEGLERISGTGTDAVRPWRPAPADGEPDGGAGADDAADDAPAAILQPGEIAEEATVTGGAATIDGEGADYRFAAVAVEVPGQGTYTVYAGGPLAAEQNAVRTAQTAMLIGFPLLLGVVAGVTWRVTGRALHPVAGIRREMAEITASEDLSRRVPEPDTHDEVARLARTTNETLAALEASVDRQRRFVADASHELRSPIASLRTQLEVAAAHPELLDLDGAVEDTVRLQRLAADLLLLARLDAGERPVGARVDLAELAREQAAGRAGRVTVRGPPRRRGITRPAGTGAGQSAGQRPAARALGGLRDRTAGRRPGGAPGGGRRGRRPRGGPRADLRAVRAAGRGPQPGRGRRRSGPRHRPGRRRPPRRHPHGP
ncbi:hypothetical protein GCM10020295_24980 [Streptomyces cinereospinus]